MADAPFNDNDAVSGTTAGPDAHGQAAILLIESLIHGLIARSVISVAEAMEIIDIAAEAKEEIGIDRGDSSATMEKSRRVLEAMSISLSFDLPHS